MEDSICLEMMKLYQREYSAMNEIYRLTSQLAELLGKNDQVSAQIVLGMRQEELDRAQQCKSKIAVLEDAMEANDRQRLKQMMEDPSQRASGTVEEKKIAELHGKIQTMLDKTIALDKRINTRLAGKDSYYSK